MADLAEAREAKEKLRADLEEHDGVRAVGLTWLDPGWAIKVEVDAPDESLPEEVDGVPVQTEVVGKILPLG